MEASSASRVEHTIEALASLDPVSVARWREQVAWRMRAFGGTTHVSIIDAAGNIASATVSNGEGSSYVIPGTGIVMNNMLGEDDLNPKGFHQWTPDERMTSMMAPTALAWRDGRRIATGSGGSNRIRTALLQVLVNLVDFAMDVEDAVSRAAHPPGGFIPEHRRRVRRRPHRAGAGSVAGSSAMGRVEHVLRGCAYRCVRSAGRRGSRRSEAGRRVRDRPLSAR